MGEKEKILVTYIGINFPVKSIKKAFENLEEDGKLYLLHVIDDAPIRDMRYQTNQPNFSDMIQTVKKTKKEIQKKSAKKFAESVAREAEKLRFSVEPLYAYGDPAEETLRVIDNHSIQLVIVEKLRDRLLGFFHGEETEYLRKKAPCKVLRAS